MHENKKRTRGDANTVSQSSGYRLPVAPTHLTFDAHWSRLGAGDVANKGDRTENCRERCFAH